ncbi:hypothetical protein BC628DRAFT_1374049 [Trametes gibbosa]|nr:hypothetical protein BC628DRAFT_1374049 [Trametes gibbosa]
MLAHSSSLCILFSIIFVYSTSCFGSPHPAVSAETHTGDAIGETWRRVASVNSGGMDFESPVNDQQTLHARARTTLVSSSSIPSVVLPNTDPTQATPDPFARRPSSSTSSAAFDGPSEVTVTLTATRLSAPLATATSSPSAPTPVPTPTEVGGTNGLSTTRSSILGIALGVVFGFIVLVALVGAALALARRRRQRRVAPSTAYLRRAAAAATQERPAAAESTTDAQSGGGAGAGGSSAMRGLEGSSPVSGVSEMQQWAGADSPTTPVSTLHMLAPLRPNSFRDQTGASMHALGGGFQ